MWEEEWRDRVWSQLHEPWDVIVIGGGITGAGILRESVRLGLRALLVERRDFGWGTSSRSAKLVHGGLRYLKEGKLRLTRASVHERERLLEEGAGLIDPLGFLLATYKGDRPGRWTYGAGLSVYDLMGLQWTHSHYSARDFQMLAPHITQDGLEGGFRYGDAQTDDARLVLRVIREAVAGGGTAINYVSAAGLLRDAQQHAAPTIGVRLHDAVADRETLVTGRVVINATGAWADHLRGEVGAEARIRPLRGSHLIFPAWRVPMAQALSFLHPIDRRPVFIFPWEGITLVGTTDVDHDQPLDEEPAISPDEVSYLMAAVDAQFPSLDVGIDDVISTFAGVRPVIGTGRADPSKESRDHVVWEERGLLTVTGGKLTTFRLIALDVLRALRHRLPDLPELDNEVPVLNQIDVELPGAECLDKVLRKRLLGRYGADAPLLVANAQAGELQTIPGTETLWAELRWAAGHEGVVHLDDLMLRRVRLGHLLPKGGEAILPMVRTICQSELGWSDDRWDSEQRDYLAIWSRAYSLPDPAEIPDWREMLAEAKIEREAAQPTRRRAVIKRTTWAAILAGAAILLAALFLRMRHPSER